MEISPALQKELEAGTTSIHPGSKFKSANLVRYRHTTEKRREKPFPIHECVALVEIEHSGNNTFVLCHLAKIKNGDWGFCGVECGDRENTPPLPYESFAVAPNIIQAQQFISERLAFISYEKQRVLTDWSWDNVEID